MLLECIATEPTTNGVRNIITISDDSDFSPNNKFFEPLSCQILLNNQTQRNREKFRADKL